MPPTPPEYGYGPANYANQGGSNPFDAFDNRIRYNDMVRHQMVSQYQQGVVRPSTMTLGQARQVATQQRFQYGVSGGQDPRHYERQAQLSRMAYGSSVAKGAVDMGMFGVAEAGAGLMGAGVFGSLALPMVATALPMHMVNKGVQNSLERRKFMHGIASDVEQYRDRLGFSGGLSYSQSTQLGKSLQESMFTPGQFFSKEQQMNIHKIGLSNNLISAKGKGLGSGGASQYKRNFEELRETTEEVVKLLQTTIEGGMSVIKELQQKGFGNIRQIKQQVQQAKTFGGYTGMGAQNMMNLGAAGAQAAQGTPWAANVGASMYQLGSTEAATLANSGRAGAYAVKRVGGTAAAGAAIGNFAMNMLQSGIGTKLAAYAMKSDGSVDEGRLQRVLSGRAGGYEIVTGANRTGYAMGENRVRFGMFKEDMLNQLSDKERMQMVTSGFNAWSKQRPYSSLKNRAYVFAGEFTNNSREQRLIYENLMTVKDYGTLAARGAIDRAVSGESMGSSIGLRKKFETISKGYNRAQNAVGDLITSTSIGLMDDASEAWEGVTGGLARGFEKTIQGMGLAGASGFIDKTSYGDMRSSYENLYGLKGGVKTATIDRASMQDIERVRPTGGIDAQSLISRWKRAGNYERNIQKLGVIAGSGDYGQLLKDPRFNFNKEEMQTFNTSPQASYLGMMNQLSGHSESIHSEYERAVGAVNTSEKIKNRDAKQLRTDNLFLQRIESSIKSGDALKIDDQLKSTSVQRRKAVYETEKINQVVNTSFGSFATETEMRGELKSEGGLYIGTKGVSSEVANLAKARLAMFGLGPLTPTFAAHSKNAASIAENVDYSSALGVKAGRGWLEGRTYQQKSRLKTLRKAYGKRFDFETKEGQSDFAEFALKEYTSGDADSLEKLQGALGGSEALEGFIAKANRGELLKEAKRSEARTVNFMGIAKKTESYRRVKEKGNQDLGTFESLMGKAYAGILSKDEFTSLKGYKNIITDTLGGAATESFGSANEFMSTLRNNAVEKEKDSPLSNVRGMNEELKSIRQVLKGEAEKVKVTTIDGKAYDVGSNVDSKEERILLARERELQQQIADEEKYKAPTQTSTNNAVVRPPVLNYWNNRWVL